jgi:sugar/nucleoside kinase (ribokinase family)
VSAVRAAGVVVVGDAVLDVTVAPREVVQPGADARATIVVAPGGQGANVAVRLARRGVDARLVGAVGGDRAADLLRAALVAERVTLHELRTARSGTVVSLLDDGGERTMLSDRIPVEPVALDPVLRSAMSGAIWLHVSGYALRQPDGVELARRLRAAVRSGVAVSVAGGSLPPDGHGRKPFIAAVGALGPDLLVLARGEAIGVTGRQTERGTAGLAQLAEALSEHAPVAVVTGGASGAAMAVEGEAHLVPPPAQAAVVDATGAGDGFVAGVIRELLDVDWPPTDAALERAMRAGAALGAAVAGVRGAQGRVAGEAPEGGQEAAPGSEAAAPAEELEARAESTP